MGMAMAMAMGPMTPHGPWPWPMIEMNYLGIPEFESLSYSLFLFFSAGQRFFSRIDALLGEFRVGGGVHSRLHILVFYPLCGIF